MHLLTWCPIFLWLLVMLFLVCCFWLWIILIAGGVHLEFCDMEIIIFFSFGVILILMKAVLRNENYLEDCVKLVDFRQWIASKVKLALVARECIEKMDVWSNLWTSGLCINQLGVLYWRCSPFNVLSLLYYYILGYTDFLAKNSDFVLFTWRLSLQAYPLEAGCTFSSIVLKTYNICLVYAKRSNWWGQHFKKCRLYFPFFFFFLNGD